MIHNAYRAFIEAATSDATAEKAVAWIDSVMREAFTLAKAELVPAGLGLNAADPAERVAEALAVWLYESSPAELWPIMAGADHRQSLPPHIRMDVEQREAAERIAEREAEARAVAEREAEALRTLAGDYRVESFDDAADGMERLRNRNQFILLAYAVPDATPEALLAELMADVDSVARPDGFSYDSARAAVRYWFHYDGGRDRLDSACAAALELPPPELEGAEDDAISCRLYVAAPDGMAG